MKEQQLSPTKTMSLGLQHVLAMYAGAMLVPIIVGGALGLTPQQLAYLISIDLVTCGIATLLQMWKNKYFGTGLPAAMKTLVADGMITGNLAAIFLNIALGGLRKKQTVQQKEAQLKEEALAQA